METCLSYGNYGKPKTYFWNVVSLYPVSKTNRRDGFHGLFRYLGRLIQII